MRIAHPGERCRDVPPGPGLAEGVTVAVVLGTTATVAAPVR